MTEKTSNEPSSRSWFTDGPRGVAPKELWRLHGATDDLRGLAIKTSFGYALGLELDAELVLLHLQPSLDSLVATAERIETALIAQGWSVIPSRGERSVLR
jgi:hypothetical protein